MSWKTKSNTGCFRMYPMLWQPKVDRIQNEDRRIHRLRSREYCGGTEGRQALSFFVRHQKPQRVTDVRYDHTSLDWPLLNCKLKRFKGHSLLWDGLGFRSLSSRLIQLPEGVHRMLRIQLPQYLPDQEQHAKPE